ncbi:Rho termination factor, N-terminal [uncultured Caudovirales phage]|uniref:Rho termination factor, N-terminal n=1 Tax=uncultured Caudovirales phage TaxID=2100421 RepID=A0A6J5NFD7_9CAUD|nr:Rho termination factor, N-terminal [uncultured Caudovirales phage]
MTTTTEVVEQFTKKTVPQLKAYAKKHNIDLYGTNTKEEMLEAILPFVPRQDPQEVKTVSENPTEKMALYSERNLHWNGVGALEKGYNIVTKEESVKWLTHKAVREASPKEVAKHYGKI